MKPYSLEWWLWQISENGRAIGTFTEIKHRAPDEKHKRTTQSLIDYEKEKREWLLNRVGKTYENEQK